MYYLVYMHTHIIQTSSPVLIFSPTQAAPAVGGEVEESGCGTNTDPIIIIDSEEEEEEEEKESDGERRGGGGRGERGRG